MRTFIIIWLGQLVSTVGSYMTSFALTLWAWEDTGSATALALVGFFSQLPRVFVTLFSGVIVDRLNRKHLMILADAIAVLSSVVILILYSIHALQIWHLYLIGAINSSFAQIQQLAYTTSLTLLVPPQQYTRVSSMGSVLNYGPAIFAPALAGSLYSAIGLGGILLIDILTFFAAFITLISVHIPQPMRETMREGDRLRLKTIRQDILFGFQYVFKQPHLRMLLLFTSSFWMVHDLGEAIYDPMILARTDGNAAILASTSVAAGIGGVTGAVIVSIWGGTKRRIRGLLNGMIGAGISKTMFGLGRIPAVWVTAQGFSSLNFPLLGSSEDALWLANVTPEIQGRVFAASALILQACSAIAMLIAGPLADRVFEPMMQSNGQFAALFSPIVGTGAGAGIALLYVMTSSGLLVVGIGGYRIPQLWAMEKTD
ncbi:MFS transporter [Egbenema bharatensis]|uniref:MFS transporter n=1 Tax=Egbenema bharatensis TaxID=3463334 RepID=UPI003A848474